MKASARARGLQRRQEQYEELNRNIDAYNKQALSDSVQYGNNSISGGFPMQQRLPVCFASEAAARVGSGESGTVIRGRPNVLHTC